MTAFVPPQLTRILGNDLDTIDEAALRRLIGVTEGDVLEFKRDHYGVSDGQKRELALDLTAFANAGGGLLIVGMDEDKDTAEATDLAPLPVQPHGTEEDTRYRQVVASNVFPPIDLHTARVDVEGGSVLLASVPPSRVRPHAVVKDHAMRYPVRYGAGRRWMYQWEVAGAYRDQFDSANTALERVHDLRDGLVRDVRRLLAATDDPEDASAWVVMALSPDRAGNVRIDHDTVRQTRDWAKRTITVPIRSIISELHPTAGFRSFTMTDKTGSRQHQSRLVLTLAGSGDGAGAFRIDHGRYQPDYQDPMMLYDELLFLTTLALSELLAAHAVDRCGTGGTSTALINLEIVGSGSAALAQNRQYGMTQQLGDTRVLKDSTPVGRRTVALEDLWPASPGLVSVAGALLSDVISPFGLPTPYQADPDGRIRKKYFAQGFQDAVLRWASTHHIEVTDDTA